MTSGIVLKRSSGGDRIQIGCKHQNGLVYVVPSNANWVCDEKSVHAHSLAGFLKEVFELNLPSIQEISQKWGIYYREIPLD
tara:strand:+ start:68 stop:310 length:243 start_codon:yes stop_codon:yes gene_type:complete